jgi:hypothetical protein
LAANFYVIETGETNGEFGEDQMGGAARLGSWYLGEALRVIEAAERPGAAVDAGLLLEWLSKQPAGKGIEPRQMLRVGPKPLRTRKSRNAALDYLAERHCLREKDGKVFLNPKLRRGAK